MVNSSPPMRATVSDSRKDARAQVATCCNTLSPTAWPSIVDFLEAVEVHGDQRERLLLAPADQDRLLQAVVEQRAVRQAGEVVVHRLVLEQARLLGALRMTTNAIASPEADGRGAQQQQQQARVFVGLRRLGDGVLGIGLLQRQQVADFKPDQLLRTDDLLPDQLTCLLRCRPSGPCPPPVLPAAVSSP